MKRWPFLVVCMLTLSGLAGLLQITQAHSGAAPNSWHEVGYCIASRLTIQQKEVIANAQARPADPTFVGRLLPVVLDGEVSEEKQAASRAIRERDELRHASSSIVRRIAEACGYNAFLSNSPTASPLDAALEWLRYDGSFKALLAYAMRQPPDAAARLAARLGTSSLAAVHRKD